MNEGTSSIIENDSTTANSAVVSSSPTRSSSGDEAGFLLPEFNDLVLEEFQSSMPEPYPDPNPNQTQIQSTKEFEKEISFLRNTVCSLQEKEKLLELKLQEFSNVKKQEISSSELMNQLKVKNVETKLCTLKIESLLSQNQSFLTELSDFSRTTAELVEAKEQVRVLMNKVQLAREEMERMRNGEKERMKRLEDLEEKLRDLRVVNARLEEEKLELVQQLELQKVKLRTDPTSFHTSKEAEVMEENENLRHEIEKLNKEIEQLKTSRCADLEELVYLKWINACLRYELREHQPSHGKTLARDLSITLSPNSKEKAKKLIQDYAYNSGPTSSDDFNWEYSSESSGDSSKNGSSNKSKLFGKLRNLVSGKDKKRIDKGGDSFRFSWDSVSSCTTEDMAIPVQVQQPLDRRERIMRCRSDAGVGYRGKAVVPLEEYFPMDCLDGNDFHVVGFDGSEVPEKTRLKKLADALEDPRGGGNINRRAASFSYSTFNAFAVE